MYSSYWTQYKFDQTPPTVVQEEDIEDSPLANGEADVELRRAGEVVDLLTVRKSMTPDIETLDPVRTTNTLPAIDCANNREGFKQQNSLFSPNQQV